MDTQLVDGRADSLLSQIKVRLLLSAQNSQSVHEQGIQSKLLVIRVNRAREALRDISDRISRGRKCL